MLHKIKSHVSRIRNHLGRDVLFGSERFKVHGYYANQLITSDHHERNLATLFTRELTLRPGVFIDVGVNIGQTMCKVLGADRSRRYVGFEPQIGCCFFVDQFFRHNGLTNATILPIALSDVNGAFTLWSSNSCDEMASLGGRDSGVGIDRSHATHVITRVGDEVLIELGVNEICAIKIDVEGAERKVLAGLIKTLHVRRPTVFFEMLPNFFGDDRILIDAALAANNRVDASAIYYLFSKLHYQIFQIDEQSNEIAISAFELDDRDRYISFNYVARPGR